VNQAHSVTKKLFFATILKLLTRIKIKFIMKYLFPMVYRLQLLLFLVIAGKHGSAQKAINPWYSFSADNRECIIKNSNLPTPWLNRLGNDVFFTWITQNGYIESFLLDPASNGLTNPQNTSGRFYIRDKSNGSFFQINVPAQKGEWESRVGLGYNKISNNVGGIRAEATYFVPREDNVLVMMVDITNNTGQDKTLDLFGQVEWNLGDPTKSIIYKGDGRGGSQFNLYKKAFMHDNTILARQENWKSTANCIAWPYTGFFSVNEPLTSYETIKDNFIGTGRDYDHPVAIEKGSCTKSNFWSEADYPCGVLQNTIRLKSGNSKTLIYLLGMSREENDIPKIISKYKDEGLAKKSLDNLRTFYNKLVNGSVYVETPDKENDRMINIWTKYQWRQFWKKNLNDGGYGLGLWSYGLEGESLGTSPEQFLLPFDTTILKNCIIHLLRRQMSDTTQTNVFGPGEHSMLYKDLGLAGPPVSPKGPFQFKVPHHHSIYELFGVYYYLIESGDLGMLDMKMPYVDGKEGSVWEHIQTGLTISVKGIDDRGLPRIPANVGDWMDEFTKISRDGNAESEMLAAEMCFLLKGFAEIAGQTNHEADSIKWMSIYNRMKDAVNKLAWDGEWYIRAFSDRGNPFIPVGTKNEKEGMIYLNAQSWPVLSGIATPQQATRSLLSVKKYLISDYGPMIFSPSFSHYVDYIGTQSIYSPGFRNACIYLRPAGWAIAAACLNNQPDLANEMYDKAAMKSREKDMEHFHCEPYVYTENYDGPDHRLKGQGEFQWNLGEGAAWMWASYVDYILGVRPVLKGLLIDPKIPSEWPGFTIKRDFRGDQYFIRVVNPAKVSQGVKYILLDGKRIAGNVIIPVKDGKEHQVKVVMGK
jgi:cellobiose phosphorylase